MTISNDQLRKDSNYCRDYRAWIMSLPKADRARAELAGLGRPSPSRPSNRDVLHSIDTREASTKPDVYADEADAEMNKLAAAFSEFLHWVVLPDYRSGIQPKSIGQRATMALWVMRPDIIGAPTLEELARKLATSPEVLSRQASAFSARFGIKGRSQFSARSRAHMATAKGRLNEQSKRMDTERN